MAPGLPEDGSPSFHSQELAGSALTPRKPDGFSLVLLRSRFQSVPFMSEIQNRAIQLFHSEPDGVPITTPEFRQQMLEAAFALYHALGGSEVAAKELARQSFKEPKEEVATAVGDVMVALAGVSYLQDMDMMQAAYNRLRLRYRQAAQASSAMAG